MPTLSQVDPGLFPSPRSESIVLTLDAVPPVPLVLAVMLALCWYLYLRAINNR